MHGEPLESAAEARLEALVKLDRGVDVAKADLELRGAGDLGGTRQSGLEEELLYLDPASPPTWLARVDGDARAIFAADPELARAGAPRPTHRRAPAVGRDLRARGGGMNVAEPRDERALDRWSFDALWVRAGVVLAAWFVLLVAENLAVAIAFRTEFAGSWETRATRRLVVPIALGALLPASFAIAGVARVAERRRSVVAALAAASGGLTAWGVSSGRHMASLAVRAPFVAVVAATAAGFTWWAIAASRAGIAREAGRRRARGCGRECGSRGAPTSGSCRASTPPFTSPSLRSRSASGALIALALRPGPGDRTRAPAAVALLALAFGGLALSYAPTAARLVASSDNLRIILVEHAPLEGRAVSLASLLAPAPSDFAPDTSISPPGELPRALDWTGRDVVLLTIDALRADHVSAYGYPRRRRRASTRWRGAGPVSTPRTARPRTRPIRSLRS